MHPTDSPMQLDVFEPIRAQEQLTIIDWMKNVVGNEQHGENKPNDNTSIEIFRDI